MRLRPKILLAILLAGLMGLAQPAITQRASAEGTGGAIKDAIGKLLGSRDDSSKPAEVTRQAPSSREQVQLSFAPVVKQVANSVVNVYAARQVSQRSPFSGDPFFERFFGPNGFGLPQQRKQRSLGSGVIVSEDGVVLTNNHVIENMDEVKVALADGREFDCEILLRDKKSDLAVLKIKDGRGVDLNAIEIGDSDAVEVGDLVLAIGNPFGVGQTVTSGIVSAVSRSLAGINDYGYFIQTDAAINPGNSGGALVDMDGRLIGINTAIYSRSGGSIGLGYAIPSNMTTVVLSAATNGGTMVRPWIGANFQSVNADMADSLGLDRPTGAIVTSLYEDGPAEKGSLKVGDVVLAVNGKPVKSADNLGYRLDTVGIGSTAELTVLSRGKQRTASIDLTAPPETVPRDEVDLGRNSILAGARIANLSPAVAVEAGISTDKSGVVVLEVERNSAAAANGLQPGDIVREVNGVKIEDTGELEKIASSRQRGWQFIVDRGDRTYVFERQGAFFRQFVE